MTMLMNPMFAEILTGPIIIVAAVALAVVVLLVFITVLSRYTKVGPNEVLVASGMRHNFPDPDGNATPFANFEAKSLAWRNNWNDAKAIEMSKAAAVESDPAKRETMYKELTDYVQHNGPYALLYEPSTIFAVRNNIKGFVYDPTDTPTVSFWLISKS